MNKQQIRADLLNEIGSELEPVIDKLIDRLEIIFKTTHKGAFIKPGETFWLLGTNYTAHYEAKPCKECVFTAKRQCTLTPCCGQLIYKVSE